MKIIQETQIILERIGKTHLDSEGPSRGFSERGWKDNLPRSLRVQSPWELVQQSLMSMVAMKTPVCRITKTETTQVSPRCREPDLKRGIRRSWRSSVTSAENLHSEGLISINSYSRASELSASDLPGSRSSELSAIDFSEICSIVYLGEEIERKKEERERERCVLYKQLVTGFAITSQLWKLWSDSSLVEFIDTEEEDTEISFKKSLILAGKNVGSFFFI